MHRLAPFGCEVGCRGDHCAIRYCKDFSKLLNQKAFYKPIALHILDDDYYNRIEAIQFTMSHDDGKKTEVASKIGFPNGIHTTTDHAFLLVTNTRGRFNIGFQIQGNGRLTNRQPYGHLHRGNADNDTGADGVTIDTAGRLYCTTRMGVQVLDQLGRVHLILEKPSSGWLSNAVFGGAKLDTLYVTCGTEVYKRKLKATGVRPWKAPHKAGRPNL